MKTLRNYVSDSQMSLSQSPRSQSPRSQASSSTTSGLIGSNMLSKLWNKCLQILLIQTGIAINKKKSSLSVRRLTRQLFKKWIKPLLKTLLENWTSCKGTRGNSWRNITKARDNKNPPEWIIQRTITKIFSRMSLEKQQIKNKPKNQTKRKIDQMMMVDGHNTIQK